MKQIKILFGISGIALLPLLTNSCSGNGYTAQQERTTQGAVGGAVLGGIIGHQSGRALEGAAIGGAAGGAAGYATAR